VSLWIWIFTAGETQPRFIFPFELQRNMQSLRVSLTQNAWETSMVKKKTSIQLRFQSDSLKIWAWIKWDLPLNFSLPVIPLLIINALEKGIMLLKSSPRIKNARIFKNLTFWIFLKHYFVRLQVFIFQILTLIGVQV
jgi:hypothetical protein